MFLLIICICRANFELCTYKDCNILKNNEKAVLAEIVMLSTRHLEVRSVDLVTPDDTSLGERAGVSCQPLSVQTCRPLPMRTERALMSTIRKDFEKSGGFAVAHVGKHRSFDVRRLTERRKASIC